jgi:hypothetical protein
LRDFSGNLIKTRIARVRCVSVDWNLELAV